LFNTNDGRKVSDVQPAVAGSKEAALAFQGDQVTRRDRRKATERKTLEQEVAYTGRRPPARETEKGNVRNPTYTIT
jgi:hypothetical protein